MPLEKLPKLWYYSPHQMTVLHVEVIQQESDYYIPELNERSKIGKRLFHTKRHALDHGIADLEWKVSKLQSYVDAMIEERDNG